MARPWKIVFMGTPEFAVPSLKKLLSSPDRVVAVVTQPDRPRGRGRRLRPSPVKKVAEQAGIEVLQPERASSPEFIEKIRAYAPDLLVVAAYGQILKQELLDVPKIMPINVHGSLLPKYRGAAPIQWAILNGEKETGITIMKMDAGMDTGPILLQKAIPIGDEETFGELYERMAHLGAELLLKAITGLKNGEISPVPQPEEGVSYAPFITKEMCLIDWSKSARELNCLVRALDPAPGAYTFLHGKRLRLYRPFLLSGGSSNGTEKPGTVVSAAPNGLVVATGHGLLGFREVQLAGKKRMDISSFIQGKKIEPGTILGEEPPD